MSISSQQEVAMSNSVPATHPAVVLRSQYRNLRSLVAVLTVAVVGLTTGVVILASDEDNPVTSTGSVAQPAARLGDPLQARTQPARESSKPDESAIAAGITAQPPVIGPDESRIAAAIGSGPTTPSVGRPDEAKVASELSQNEDTGPATRAQAYQEALRTMTPEQLERAFGVK
jgi:hypothetical protein